jgi:hypothetical protein
VSTLTHPIAARVAHLLHHPVKPSAVAIARAREITVAIEAGGIKAKPFFSDNRGGLEAVGHSGHLSIAITISVSGHVHYSTISMLTAYPARTLRHVSVPALVAALRDDMRLPTCFSQPQDSNRGRS